MKPESPTSTLPSPTASRSSTWTWNPIRTFRRTSMRRFRTFLATWARRLLSALCRGPLSPRAINGAVIRADLLLRRYNPEDEKWHVTYDEAGGFLRLKSTALQWESRQD